MSRGKKVIAFDSWTQGSVNLERLVPAFKEKGLDLMLIHIGSWGHDRNRSKEEYIGQLLVRDISYYRGMSLNDILAKEKPCAVLFLSTTAFAHRAFNRYCKQLNIPTIHRYHGLVRVQPVELASNTYKINLYRQVKIIFGRIGKQIKYIWPFYIKSLLKTNATFKEWCRFIQDIIYQGLGRSYLSIAAPDSTTDICCVYTEADISHAVERYRMKANYVFAVGNPDIMKFGVKEEDLGSALYFNKPKDEIVYIDTALIDVGAVFSCVSDFVEHILVTEEKLKSQGYKLAVKLHPVHFITGTSETHRNKGIELCTNGEFVSRLKTARAAIVEPSSAAMIPALLGLPLLLAQFGKLAGQQYGQVLTSYPRARFLKNLESIKEILKEEEKACDVQTVWNWIRENSGPLPAEDMPKRVAEVVLYLVENKVMKKL